MTDRVLAVVPAREGSKGIPRKNLRVLGDRPLVAHAIEKSKSSDLVDEVALTTDSSELANIGRRYGADTVIDRPDSLATDEVPLAPVIEHALATVDGAFDYVLCFQPTVPLVTVDSLEDGIRRGIDTGADSVVYVRDATHQYWRSRDGEFEQVSSTRANRQQMAPIYEEIGLFLSSADLVRDGRRVGDDPALHEVSAAEGVDIDTYSDWLLAESYLNRSHLVYRVVGNAESGSGHVYRGMTIADSIFEHDITFAVGEEDDLAIEKLEESNYEYEVFSDDAAFVQYVRDQQPSVVVNDVLNTSISYMSKLSATGARVVNFEDLGNGVKYADAVINALYEYSDPPETHYFGYKYFCLRNEFRYAEAHDGIPSVERVMVSFGGTDVNDLTARTLRALSMLEHDLEVDVVLGLGYRDRDALQPILDAAPANLDIEVKQDIQSMAEHLSAADLLITSNGRTLYEAGSLNTPMISIAQNQREQRHPYAHVSRGVLSLGQADYVSEEMIRSAVVDYIEDDAQREAMCDALSEHDIANGIERVTDILFEPLEGDAR